MKKLILFLFAAICPLALQSLQAQDLRIEPLNWWVGMKNPKLQLLIHGKDLKGADVIAKKPGLKIEVETRNLGDVKKVLATGKVNRIMLDNFTPEQIKEAVALIGEQIETEASGGINLSNIQTYAAAGVDYVSVGALIHQARSLDLSLKAVVAS